MEETAVRHEKLNRRLPLLAGLLCVIQPLLDVTAYWLRELEISSTWTSVLRLCLLVCGFCAGFLVTRRRRAYVLFSLVILAYLAGHILACIRTEAGYLNWSEDITDQIRTLVLPVTAISFMSYLKANPKVLPVMMKAMAVNLGIILLVQVVSTLTGTDPHTYPTKAAGIRGWFIWPSPQSAILSILSPVVIAWSLRRWPKQVLPVLLISIVSFGMLFIYGTRLGYLTVAGVGLGMAVCVFPGGKTHRYQAAGILLSAVLILAFYPVSPMAANRAAVEENERVKQLRVSSAVASVRAGQTEPESAESGVPTDRELAAAYRYNLQGMIDRFGLDQVAARYGRTLDSRIICNDRTMKTRFCSLLMEQMSAESPLSRFFGVELARTRVDDTEVYDFYSDDWYLGTENYDPENDVCGVLTLNGWVGLALLAVFLLAFLALAVRAVIRERQRFTPLFAAFLGAYGIAVIYAAGTASTLRRNNASVYFAWILAGLWYLSVRPLQEGERRD